jgi:hypothetical protein
MVIMGADAKRMSVLMPSDLKIPTISDAILGTIEGEKMASANIDANDVEVAAIMRNRGANASLKA